VVAPPVLVVVVTPLALPAALLLALALAVAPDAELVVIVIEATVWVSVEVILSEEDVAARRSELSSEGYTSNGLSASGTCDGGGFGRIGDIS
jgi:hypothetical protein